MKLASIFFIASAENVLKYRKHASQKSVRAKRQRQIRREQLKFDNFVTATTVGGILV